MDVSNETAENKFQPLKTRSFHSCGKRETVLGLSNTFSSFWVQSLAATLILTEDTLKMQDAKEAVWKSN